MKFMVALTSNAERLRFANGVSFAIASFLAMTALLATTAATAFAAGGQTIGSGVTASSATPASTPSSATPAATAPAAATAPRVALGFGRSSAPPLGAPIIGPTLTPQPAPLYFPADPNIAFGDPSAGYPGPVVADQYAQPYASPNAVPFASPFGGSFSANSQRPFRIVGGVELVLVEPFLENNQALFITNSDGVTSQSVRGVEFDYDVELSPRFWLKAEMIDGLGIRGAYWQFDHSAQQVSANAPANGFGRVSPPNVFGNIDISAVAPGERLTAQSSLELCVFDLEGVKDARFAGWRLVAAGGVRYAEVNQRYTARLTNNGVLAGQIDLRRDLDGFGPTAALLVERPLPWAFTFFTDTRFSMLFGDGSSTLSAGEDLDLANPFRTNATSGDDSLMFVTEAHLGLLWGPRIFRQWHPFVGVAFERQFWTGVGSATSEQGSLGLFGLNVMFGASW